MFIAATHGFVLALALILPIGMQNGFIISQGAVHQRWTGALPAVVTAGICDTLLIGLAVIGVSTGRKIVEKYGKENVCSNHTFQWIKALNT